MATNKQGKLTNDHRKEMMQWVRILQIQDGELGVANNYVHEAFSIKCRNVLTYVALATYDVRFLRDINDERANEAYTTIHDAREVMKKAIVACRNARNLIRDANHLVARGHLLLEDVLMAMEDEDE